MNNWPNEAVAELNAYYGKPDSNGDAAPDPLWEMHNIVNIIPPYRMVLAWNPLQAATRIRVHGKCATSLLRVLQAIGAHYGSQEAIEAANLHLYGGAYMFRLMRGAPRLSVHSWGAAIDLDPGHNRFGETYDPSQAMMPQPAIDAFAAEGWTWGGRWHTADAMHFQAATV